MAARIRSGDLRKSNKLGKPETERIELQTRKHRPVPTSSRRTQRNHTLHHGFRYGSTDETDAEAVENKLHHHDLHATILHILGLDHERLTYRYGGRDYKLTGVGGANVAEGILA